MHIDHEKSKLIAMMQNGPTTSKSYFSKVCNPLLFMNPITLTILELYVSFLPWEDGNFRSTANLLVATNWSLYICGWVTVSLWRPARNSINHGNVSGSKFRVIFRC